MLRKPCGLKFLPDHILQRALSRKQEIQGSCILRVIVFRHPIRKSPSHLCNIGVILHRIQTPHVSDHQRLIRNGIVLPRRPPALRIEVKRMQIQRIRNRQNPSAFIRFLPEYGNRRFLRAGHHKIALLRKRFPEEFCRKSPDSGIHARTSGMRDRHRNPCRLRNRKIHGSHRGHMSLYRSKLMMHSEKFPAGLSVFPKVGSGEAGKDIDPPSKGSHLFVQILRLSQLLQRFPALFLFISCLIMHQKIKLNLPSVHVMIQIHHSGFCSAPVQLPEHMQNPDGLFCLLHLKPSHERPA